MQARDSVRESAPLPKLTAAMGHEERTVRLGLQWLEERGQIRATELEEEFSIKPGPGSGEGDLSTESPLREALDEAQAYRTYAFQGEETLARQSV